MTEAKAKTDWEAVERAFRAGVLSIREIAKLHGCSDTAIRKKATAYGWERDLSERVNEKVRTELVRSEVRTQDPQTDREIVEVAAATVVQVVRSHRKAIQENSALVDMLTSQLMEVASSRHEYEAIIDEMTEEDKTAERRNRLMRAISLPTHTSAAVNLANARKTLIQVERQAFNIKDDIEPKTDEISTLIAAINGTSLPIVKET